MKTLYFDVFSGASGDMILAALLDVGAPLDHLRTELSRLAIPGLTLDVEKVKRSGIMCSHLKLNWDNRDSQMNHRHLTHGDHAHQDHSHHDHAHQNHVHYNHEDHDHGHEHSGKRHYEHHHDKHINDESGFRNPRQILDIIKKAAYNDSVNSRCEKILMRLAKAEAEVHGVSVDEVHFHEIGAIDTIVDIAGICICLDALGVDRILFSTLTDGRGTITTRHGIMPVPVPAVVKLAEGFSFKRLDVESELLTPTGCAVLTALGEQIDGGLDGVIQKSGYGCGDKVLENNPNALRIFLAETTFADDTSQCPVWCIESDMDHISGEIMGDVAGRLMKQGALDVSWSPVFMKKGRPGYRLSVMCAPKTKQALIELVMVHTRTLGVRLQHMERVVAHREISTAQLLGSEIQEKYCSYGNTSFSKPEYESLAKLSETTGKPVIELLEEYFRQAKKKG
jgi:pyridinium-3,5-bisthiocarboxylic acid mononucleotide nickel chelatase